MLGYRENKKKATENVGLKKSGNKKKRGKRVQPFQIRLMKDMEELDPLFKNNISFEDQTKMDKITLILKPEDGLWKSQPHRFDISIPKEYPIKPPKCICKTKLWHPNFDKDGHPCLNILREDWKPVLTLNTIFIGLHFLFLEPNPADPLNEEAADQFEKNFSQFKRRARNYMQGRYW